MHVTNAKQEAQLNAGHEQVIFVGIDEWSRRFANQRKRFRFAAESTLLQPIVAMSIRYSDESIKHLPHSF